MSSFTFARLITPCRYTCSPVSHKGAGASSLPLAGGDTALMQANISSELAKYRHLLLVSAVFALPVFIISMVVMWADPEAGACLLAC